MVQSNGGDKGGVRHLAFIFDVGNVLLRWAPADILEKALPRDADRGRYARGIFSHPRWLDLDRGQIDESVAAAEFAAFVDCSVDEVMAILRAGKDSLVPLSPGIGLLEELHAARHDLICLTNMSRETYAHVHGRYDFWSRFRGVVVSGAVRIAKPDPQIFLHTLQVYGLDAANTVFIDDHAANIESARLLGITAVEYDGSESCLETIRELARRSC